MEGVKSTIADQSQHVPVRVKSVVGKFGELITGEFIEGLIREKKEVHLRCWK